MIKLFIAGAMGRMGQRIAALASQDKDFNLVYGLESSAKADISTIEIPNYKIGQDASQMKNADVVIDFTMAAATIASVLPAVEKYGKRVAYIIGTTGFNPEQEQQIGILAKGIPIVKSSNMSLGVNVFFKAAQEIAQALPDYDVHIQEAHHIHKKDKPSGTALQVGKLIRKMTGREPIYDEPVREGEIVGDHRVIFEGPMDRIELFHHAESRDIFAAGALRAAKWVMVNKKQPGLYTMQDVLGLTAGAPHPGLRPPSHLRPVGLARYRKVRKRRSPRGEGNS